MSQTPYRDMDADRQILRVIIFATCFEQAIRLVPNDLRNQPFESIEFRVCVAGNKVSAT